MHVHTCTYTFVIHPSDMVQYDESGLLNPLNP